MPPSPGDTLGPFVIDRELGRGGMGVVFLGHDTRLDRKVAIKALPDQLAGDPERLARFEREARTLAQLNHPNIAGIHGVEVQDGARYLVLEYVEGETLADRLDRGPLPIDEAMEVAMQIAAGVEAAHEAGVIHRDLKPGNVIVTPEHHAKVLDFGLARTDESGGGGGSSVSQLATVTSPARHSPTLPGVILGTAAYMSPEQARGRKLDKRTDIWSFGVTLFEMLTGDSPFAGETVTDSIGAILHKDVDLDRLPAGAPASVRALLRRCLTRDPARRLRDIGDARIELEQAIHGATDAALGPSNDPATRSPAVRWSPWVIAALALTAMTVALVRSETPSTQRGLASHLTIPTVGSAKVVVNNIERPPVISPDGRRIVYCTTDERGVDILWLQSLDAFDGAPLAGTDGASFAFWAPDGRRVGFIVDGVIKQVDTETGRVQTIHDAEIVMPRGACWTASEQILFIPHSNSAVWAISAAGGVPRQLTTVDPEIIDGSHRWPQPLPDGNRFLFLLWSNDPDSRSRHGGVYVATIDGTAPPRRILSDTSMATYAPSGHIVLVQEQSLVAVPVDPKTLDVVGAPVAIANNVLSSSNSGFGAFSLSAEGTLLIKRTASVSPLTTLHWCNRSGDSVSTPVEPSPMMAYVRLSPDDSRAAILDPGPTGDGVIWIVDLVRGARTRLTPPGPWTRALPVWSPDGDRVLYTSAKSGAWDLYVRRVDGSGDETPFQEGKGDRGAIDWRNGKVIYWHFPIGTTRPSVELYDEQSGEVRMLSDNWYSSGARLSPDGEFIVCTFKENGREEVLAQSLATGARWNVSTSGGGSPHWSSDGHEIVYESPQRQIMAVPVEIAGDELTLGQPTTLFALEDDVAAWDAAGDHQRFLVTKNQGQTAEPLRVVLNWPALLERAPR